MEKQQKHLAPADNEDTTRTKILAAARKEFIENGLRGARMQEIANRAGINKALLHYHFRDKKNLYAEALQSVITVLSSRIAKAFPTNIATQAPQDNALLLVTTYMDVLQDNPDFVGMTLRELADGGTHMEPLLLSVAPMIQQISNSILGQLESKGQHTKRNKELPHIMLNMMSLIWGTFLLKPIYAQIFTHAGFENTLQQNFYSERKKSIAALISMSAFHLEKSP